MVLTPRDGLIFTANHRCALWEEEAVKEGEERLKSEYKKRREEEQVTEKEEEEEGWKAR